MQWFRRCGSFKALSPLTSPSVTSHCFAGLCVLASEFRDCDPPTCSSFGLVSWKEGPWPLWDVRGLDPTASAVLVDSLFCLFVLLCFLSGLKLLSPVLHSRSSSIHVSLSSLYVLLCGFFLLLDLGSVSLFKHC